MNVFRIRCVRLAGPDWFRFDDLTAVYDSVWSDGVAGPRSIEDSGRGTGVFRRFVRLDMEKR